MSVGVTKDYKLKVRKKTWSLRGLSQHGNSVFFFSKKVARLLQYTSRVRAEIASFCYII
jgi:hypothetical protein